MEKKARVELFDRHLRYYFPDSEDHGDYHYFWLRHNCHCQPHCRHPITNERVLDSSEVSMDIRPETATIEDRSNLKIVWASEDKHESVFSAEWLREYAYALNRVAVPPPSSSVSDVEIDFAELQKSEKDPIAALNAQCCERLQRFGLVVVRNRGLDTEEIINEFLPTGSSIIESHFGRIEDLRTDNTTNKNTDQLGYTDAPVRPHTDQPFIETPPGMQMLHCIRPAEVGGDNYVIDAKQAALYLKSIDSHAYHLLTTVPVKFHRKQKQFESIVLTPLIETNAEGEITRLRHSYFTFAPHMVEFGKMEEWYRAVNKFTSIFRDPRYQYRFKLASGDFLMYDNYRMFHAREGFAGSRWLRGVYFNHIDVWKKLTQSS